MYGDHLGSASLVMDWQGRVISQMRYKPWGEVRWQSELDGRGYTLRTFTSQLDQRDEFVGSVMDYAARFYAPVTGRFVSADTIIQNPVDPQAFNRFSYVRNNPLRYVDPSGHCFIPVIGPFGWIGQIFCPGQKPTPEPIFDNPPGKFRATVEVLVTQQSDVRRAIETPTPGSKTEL